MRRPLPAEVASRLEGIRPSGTGYMARCPAHDDSSPSLSVSVKDTGKLLIHCHAGCGYKEIKDAAGLTEEMLDPNRGRRRESSRAPHHRNPTEAVYDYCDEQGTLLFQVLRKADKEFPQRRPDPTAKNSWTWSLGDTRRVLYRLPQVIAAVEARQTIWIAEGEKDVHSLEAAGAVATTSPGGAGKWRDEYGTPFTEGADVVIVADKDKKGREHARTVAASLAARGCRVRTVEALEGKDATDHLQAGHGLQDFVPSGKVQARRPRLKMIKAGDVGDGGVTYLWDQLLPLGAISLLPGEEGIGKTLIGIRLIADLTRATLPGEFHGHPQSALVMSTEDSIENVFKPRLKVAGADLDRVYFITARTEDPDDESDKNDEAVILPRDLPLLTEAIQKTGAVLVWIDSLVTTLPDETKTISYKDVNKVLKPIGNWADAHDVAVAAPWHLNKAAGSDAAVRMMDSRAFRTADGARRMSPGVLIESPHPGAWSG
jgi:hypothetical protein